MPLPQPHPDLAALDLLVSVSELGSISAAARAHHITQPAASMRLRGLEQGLQVQLLERTSAGAKLTPAGIATVEWAGAVLREVRTLLTGTAALRADSQSHLRLAASLTVAEYLVPRWLEQFARRMPDVQVSLQMGNSEHVTALVAAGAVELGFIEGPRAPEGLASQEIASDELLLVVGSGHPWYGRAEPVGAAQLAATPLVLRERGSGTRDVLSEELARHQLEPRPALELGSTTAIKAAVISGVGPAVVSALAVSGELRSGALGAVPLEQLHLRRTIRAVWPAGAAPARAGRELIAVAGSWS